MRTSIQGERDSSGLTLKDHIWTFTTEFMAYNGLAPEWNAVKLGIDLPENTSESKQKSHYRAAVHFMLTGEFPSVHKTMPSASEEFVNLQRAAFDRQRT
jgi:hypothetical protein